MKIVSIGLKAANKYAAASHRHHKPVRGCKFCVAVGDEKQPYFEENFSYFKPEVKT